MAGAASSSPLKPSESNPQPALPDNPDPQTTIQPSDLPQSSSTTPPPIPFQNPNPNQATPPPPSLIPPPSVSFVPSFRPAAQPPSIPSAAPPFSPLPNYQVQPPGVGSVPPPMTVPSSGAGAIPVVPSVMPSPYSAAPPPGQPIRPPYLPYPAIPHGTMPPAGIPRYPSPYTPIVRPVFPPRPGTIGLIPPLSRPPVTGIRVPIIPPVIRPVTVPNITDKPQTTVYVGKISPTIENDFILSVLKLCGPVKSWKRFQDPTSGTFKSFGFCEFESAEGVLRAMRLLNKLAIDGQELMLNVNDATREYLKHYVEGKTESANKPKETESERAEKEDEGTEATEKKEESTPSQKSQRPSLEELKKDDSGLVNKESNETSKFGLITDEDRDADEQALERINSMIEERLRNKPLPPPPPPTPVDGAGNPNKEHPSRSDDGNSDASKNVEEKNEDEMTSEGKSSKEHGRSETVSPDQRKYDRRGRDRERDLKREKERELERYERERDQERAKREKDREFKVREDDRRFKAREKEWESREREKEHWRKREKEREKERAQERKWLILEQERGGDDSYRKKRYRSDDERKRRKKEKEEDLVDRLQEEEEIAEAKIRADEEQQKLEQEGATLKIISENASEKASIRDETNFRIIDMDVDQTSDHETSHDGVMQNGTSEKSTVTDIAASDMSQNVNAPAKKLGFGLLGSGKRTAVPSVFNADEDEDMQKEKKMRPLVPIDYSTEEQQTIQPSGSEAPLSNLNAAAESGKHVPSINHKEERLSSDKERSRRSHDTSSHRDRDRHDGDAYRTRDDRVREHGLDKAKTPDNQKLLDAKQLIDMIPKTKDELFSYEINWAIYDKNSLHERMRPWISKKVIEFLGEEGEESKTLAEYIVSSMQEHVTATEMLERLQVLDEEAEMFVLKMWRMLIFEIKKVETGLALRSKT